MTTTTEKKAEAEKNEAYTETHENKGGHFEKKTMLGERKYTIVQERAGVSKDGIPNHWAIAPIYKNPETGETWTAEDEVKSVSPALGRQLIASGAWQKVGEIEQKDPRSNPNPSATWRDKEKRKLQGPGSKAAHGTATHGTTTAAHTTTTKP